MNLTPPGGVSLTLAIVALVGAAISIVSFIAHHRPAHQYADFCHIMQEISKNFPDNEWHWPSGTRSRLWKQYHIISANVERFHYLVTTPWYLSAFHFPTAWRLRNLRDSASRLKIQLIALSHIQRREELQKIMETSLSPTSTICPTDTQSCATSIVGVDNTTTYAQKEGSDTPSATLSRWWSWNKTPSATTRKAVDECLPV